MTNRSKRASSTSVIGYIRVSTTEQEQSVDAQTERIRAYCTMRELDLVEIVVDEGVSGGTPLELREQGSLAVAAIEQGKVAGIVSVKLDRLFRDTEDCIRTIKRWDKLGAALHLVDIGGQTLDTSTSTGRLFITMLAGFAEFERAIIGERTKAVLQEKKRKGLVTGGTVPYGYVQDGNRLVPDPHEQRIVSRVHELDKAGLSLRAISATLESEGLITRQGKRFSAQQIKNIITR